MAKRRRGRRDHEKELQWLERVQQWERSGLGPVDFCKQYGHRESGFFRWRRVLQERGKWVPGGLCTPSGSMLKPSARPAFTEIQIRPTQQVLEAAGRVEPSTEQMLQVILGSQYQIRVPAGFDAGTLDRLLSVLEARPC